ncbi:cytochrome P450 1A1-like [Anneissia japonica]|uniref:cytochrome P450 1A1-like n=1 Tax=Anneissia japonica TaxID=1529436 RepID=UPI001425B762|nr:cytochrome P450 1A1-like [Anneissia japonica]
MFFEIFLFVTCIWLVRTLIEQRRKGGQIIPPSPPSIPILGNIAVFMQGGPPFRILKNIGDKYGNLFSLKLGPGLAVVLHDAQTIRQALLYQGNEFAGRPRMYTTSLLSRNNSGIAFSEDFSPVWRLHRKLAATAVRHNICGKNCLPIELKIQTEVENLVDNLSKQANKVSNISRALNLTILNVICDMIFNRTYSIDDPEFLEIEDLNNKFTQVLQPGDPVDVMPFLKVSYWLYGIISTMPAFNHDANLSILNKQKQILILGCMILCCHFVHKLKLGIFSLLFCNSNIPSFSPTSVISVRVQRKIQDEMARTIGNRLPTWKDHLNLPYLEGAVLEALRRSSFTSLGGPRRAVCNTKLEGYDIPKDTIIFCNIWWAHHDPKYWDKPNEFKPERFIKDGRVFLPKAFLPFSIGRRQCLGSLLARMELFMVLGGILQRFNIRNPTGFPQPTLEPIPDMVLCPEPYKVWLEPRNIQV